MRKTRRFTALILSAVMCMHILPAGTAMASGVEGVDDSTVIVQELTEETDDSEVDTVNDEQDEPEGQVNPDEENKQEDPDDISDTFIEADGGLNDNSDDNLGDAPDAEEITELGKEYTASLDSNNNIKWFKFVPATSEKYSFYTTNADEYYGSYSCELYDENMVQLNDDRGSQGYYFSENLTEGSIYYFCVSFYSYNGLIDDSYDIKVVVSEDKDFSAYASGTEQHNYSINVDLNQSVTLSVDVIGENLSDVSYEWENGYTNSIVEGATESSYTINNVSANAYYICKVNNGTPQSESVAFYINVVNNLRVSTSDGDCYYNDENCDCYIKAIPNESKTLTVNVEGDNLEGISYLWRDNDTSTIQGVTGNTYTINSIEKNSNYYCTVTDRFGNTAMVTFHLTIDNGFKAYPSDSENHDSTSIDYRLKPNEKKTFSVTVEAYDKDGITYKWEDYNNQVIDDAMGNSYTLEKPDKNCNYICTVSDKYGNEEYINFYVTIDNELKAYPSDSEDYNTSITYTLKPNEQKTLSVIVEADDKEGITYEWYDNNGIIEGVNGNSYDIQALYNSDYTCVVTDRFGNYAYVYFHVHVNNNLRVSSTTGDC